jgi:hypothetical protein
MPWLPENWRLLSLVSKCTDAVRELEYCFLRMIVTHSRGELPGVKIGNQWRFRKAMLDAWLDDQMLGVTPRSVEISRGAPAARRMLNLASCFQPSHIVPDLEANTKTGVIEELTNLASRLKGTRPGLSALSSSARISCRARPGTDSPSCTRSIVILIT